MPKTEVTQPRGSTQWLTLGAAFLGWMFDGMEIGIFPLIARPALHELLSAQGDQAIGAWMGWITAGFLLGAALGGLGFGWLGDKVGRVRAMSLSILVYSVFTGACYWAATPGQLALLRFLAALGMGGEWSLGVALVMETWPEKDRPWLAAVIGAASNVGLVVIGVLGYVFPITQDSWRWLMLVGAAPAALTLGIRLFVPESAPWERATRNVRVRPIREIFTPPLLRNTLIAIMLASVVLIGTWASVQWITPWADQLAGEKFPQAKAVTQILIAGGAIPGCFLGALGSRFGRRPVYFTLCLVSYGLCALLFRGVTHYGPAFLLLSALVGGFTTAFYGWLPLYLPELFPTRVRATAQGISFNFGRILAAGGAIGAGQLVAHFHGDYARMGAAITVVYVAGMFLIWLGPETRGRPLPL